MPIGADTSADLLVDTSVAIALTVADHQHHETTSRALHGRRLGLAGHAAFEAFSVLSRLPPPSRRPAAIVARVLTEGFPDTRFLSAEAATALLSRLGRDEIAGGSVYDALVGATAAEHDAVLATRDQRALNTYRKLGVRVMLLD